MWIQALRNGILALIITLEVILRRFPLVDQSGEKQFMLPISKTS